MSDRSGKNSIDKIRLLVVGAMCLMVAVVPLLSLSTSNSSAKPITDPQTRSSGKRTQRPRTPAPRINYSQFSHTTHVEKQKLACDSCHKFPTKNWKELRKGDAAFSDVGEFPDHAACLNCHRQQFFAREQPAPAICANCHIAVTPRDTARWLFPSLGDLTDPKLKRRDAPSEFRVGFSHDKHLEVVGFNKPSDDRRSAFTRVSFRTKTEDTPKSCGICHQTYQPQGNSSDEYATKPPKNLGDAFWLKKGTFKSIPNSHTTCFTCHNADSGIPPESKDCNGCHKLAAEAKPSVDFDSKLPGVMGVTDRIILAQWSSRTSSGAFRHEGGAHPDISCVDCHNVAAMNTLSLATMKVPVKTCGGADGCHVTATTDEGGALNFEIEQKKKDANFVCTKCHVVFGRQAVPEHHLRAIPTSPPAKKPGA